MSAPDVVLRVENVTKRFGGVVALSDVTLSVGRGEIVGLIGPNGSGKTTLFNCITGVYKPDKGRVFFMGRDITGLQPHEVAKLGIARTWQKVRPFRNLTVLEAVTTGALLRTDSVEEARKTAVEVLELIGLPREEWGRLGSEITLMEHKLVDLARALATGPKLLLLDEIAAGLRPHEQERLAEVIKKVWSDRGLTLVVVEHVMRFVMSLSKRVVVLHEGRVIAEGPPEEVASNPRVIEAYLGIKPV
ncbi:ABC transporter ATP-binding protein [Thermogladius sp.]|uniref:ABC transporter ATP-binding protein n=1 Tax=Thermogladius sp. TaxID=2023064 RepID=UPI003D10FC0F